MKSANGSPESLGPETPRRSRGPEEQGAPERKPLPPGLAAPSSAPGVPHPPRGGPSYLTLRAAGLSSAPSFAPAAGLRGARDPGDPGPQSAGGADPRADPGPGCAERGRGAWGRRTSLPPRPPGPASGSARRGAPWPAAGVKGTRGPAAPLPRSPPRPRGSRPSEGRDPGRAPPPPRAPRPPLAPPPPPAAGR